jgi:glyoxylase-like metal-dependent hydrolase (beta-lactamase superfamily II)
MIALPPSMQVFERGWLSSNNVLFDDDGATLVDTGHATHAEQTLALVARALGRLPLARVINTHLHSDHCGGNALLARATGCTIVVPAGVVDAVHAWDDDVLSFAATGQRCERFVAAGSIAAGDRVALGGADWQALPAPGHDDCALVFFDAHDGVLISGDALWRDGCGAIFPSADPDTLERDFAAAFATLDLVEACGPRVVIPGHGTPFLDVAAALERARGRLERFEADRARNAHHVGKVLLKYRLLDERRLDVGTIHAMFRDTPILHHAHRDIDESTSAWADRAMVDLVRVGAARVDGDWLIDA